jgi:CO dehydrogenase/acetyl-CoA synthase gamma subunit (corrinoid Fe-S protein)
MGCADPKVNERIAVSGYCSIWTNAQMCYAATNNNWSFQMSDVTVAEAISRIYQSLKADNEDIDSHIATLKAALAHEGVKEAVFDPSKLEQNNRSGRKLMQAYFRQRGVAIKFSAE